MHKISGTIELKILGKYLFLHWNEFMRAILQCDHNWHVFHGTDQNLSLFPRVKLNLQYWRGKAKPLFAFSGQDIPNGDVVVGGGAHQFPTSPWPAVMLYKTDVINYSVIKISSTGSNDLNRFIQFLELKTDEHSRLNTDGWIYGRTT